MIGLLRSWPILFPPNDTSLQVTFLVLLDLVRPFPTAESAFIDEKFHPCLLGVHLTLFIWCFHLLYFRKRTRVDYIYLIYICALFILCNIGNATGLKFAAMAFIDYRNYPGGPAAFYIDQGFLPISRATNITFFLGNWLQDGLLVCVYSPITSASSFIPFNVSSYIAFGSFITAAGVCLRFPLQFLLQPSVCPTLFHFSPMLIINL